MRIKITFLFFFIFNFYSIANKKIKFIFGGVFASISYIFFKEIKNRIYSNDTSIRRFKKILKNYSFEYNDFYEKVLNNLNEKEFFDRLLSEKKLLNVAFNNLYSDASRGFYSKDEKIKTIYPFLVKYFNFLKKNKFEFSNLKIEEIEESIYLSEKDEKKETIKKTFISNSLPCYFGINNKKIKQDIKIDENYYKKRVKAIRENKFLFGYFSENKNNELLNSFDKVILKFVIKDILGNPEEKIINEVFEFLLSVQKKRNEEYLKEFKKKYGKDFESRSYKNIYNFFLERKNLTIFAFSIICFLLRNRVKSPIDFLSSSVISSEKVVQNTTRKFLLIGIVAGFLINKSNIFSEFKNGNLIQIVLGAFI